MQEASCDKKILLTKNSCSLVSMVWKFQNPWVFRHHYGKSKPILLVIRDYTIFIPWTFNFLVVSCRHNKIYVNCEEINNLNTKQILLTYLSESFVKDHVCCCLVGNSTNNWNINALFNSNPVRSSILPINSTIYRNSGRSEVISDSDSRYIDASHRG